jgi:hypothetical protein
MKHHALGLVRLYAAFTAALVVTAILGSGLILPSRLPMFCRMTLIGGAVVFTGAAIGLWRKAKSLPPPYRP